MVVQLALVMGDVGAFDALFGIYLLNLNICQWLFCPALNNDLHFPD